MQREENKKKKVSNEKPKIIIEMISTNMSKNKLFDSYSANNTATKINAKWKGNNGKSRTHTKWEDILLTKKSEYRQACCDTITNFNAVVAICQIKNNRDTEVNTPHNDEKKNLPKMKL